MFYRQDKIKDLRRADNELRMLDPYETRVSSHQWTSSTADHSTVHFSRRQFTPIVTRPFSPHIRRIDMEAQRFARSSSADSRGRSSKRNSTYSSSPQRRKSLSPAKQRELLDTAFEAVFNEFQLTENRGYHHIDRFIVFVFPSPYIHIT